MRRSGQRRWRLNRERLGEFYAFLYLFCYGFTSAYNHRADTVLGLLKGGKEMSEALRSCHNCGGGKVSVREKMFCNAPRYYVYCSTCGLCGPALLTTAATTKAWNTLQGSLHWTTETPTEEGWYWNRVAGKETIPVRLYYDSNGEYCYQVAGLPDECWLVESLTDEVGCAWAGPILEPQEPK